MADGKSAKRHRRQHRRVRTCSSYQQHTVLPPPWRATTQRRPVAGMREEVSIFSSLLMAASIGGFFIAMAGWSPPQSWEEIASFAVIWILLTYIWVQMGSLILVGAGTKNQMWIDVLTSIVPLFLIVYVLLQHHSGYVVLSSFQVKTVG